MKYVLASSDSVDTRAVLDIIRRLITNTNLYLLQSPHASLLRDIGAYITRMMKIFGVIDQEEPLGFPLGDGQAVNVG